MHGFGHIEIPTTNFKKAKKFYGTVFGWTFTDLNDVDYVMFEVKKMPKKGQVNVYVEVEDIDAKLKEIKKLRGKVVVKKEEIAGMGWWAKFESPDGCALCLWQAPPKETVPAT
jgi:predicted enzyme related to lactoylglutathione lyase